MPFIKGQKPWNYKTVGLMKNTWNKGKKGLVKMSAETRKQMSLSSKKPMLGKTHSKKARKKISESKKILFSDKTRHPRWKGGVSQSVEYKKNRYKKWVQENREKVNMYVRTRRYKVQNIHGSYTLTDWLTLKAQYNWTCPCCKRKEPKIKLAADHIIPITKGGSNNIENIQPLCKSCNSKKNNKIIPKYKI